MGKRAKTKKKKKVMESEHKFILSRERNTPTFNEAAFWPPLCPTFTHTLCSLT